MGSQTRCWELTSPWQPRTRPSARALRLTGTRGLTFAKRRGRGLTHVLHRRGQGRLVYVVRPSWGCWGSLSSPHLPRPLHSPGSQCRCSHTAQGGEEPGRSLKTPQAKSRPRRHQPLVCSASASSPWLESVFSDFSGNAIWREGQSLRGCSGWGVPDTVGATELITAFRDHYVGPVSLQLLGTVLRQPTGGLVQTGPGLWPASERTCTGEELPRRNTRKSTRRHELGPRTGRTGHAPGLLEAHSWQARLHRTQNSRGCTESLLLCLRAPCGLTKSESRGRLQRRADESANSESLGSSVESQLSPEGPAECSAGKTRCACVPVCALLLGDGRGHRGPDPHSRPCPSSGCRELALLFHDRQKSPPLDGCVL